MCEQCVAQTAYYGEPLKDIGLFRATQDGSIMKKGQWGLIEINDPFVVWTSTPRPDPMKNLSDEELEKLPNDATIWELEDDWMDFIKEFEEALTLTPELGYKLVAASLEKGFKEDQRFSMWFFDYLGMWLKEHPEPEEAPKQEINIDL